MKRCLPTESPVTRSAGARASIRNRAARLTLVMMAASLTCAVLLNGVAQGQPTITGEQKQWHKVTLDFNGPTCSENSDTFLDYRMDVTFTNGLICSILGLLARNPQSSAGKETVFLLYQAMYRYPWLPAASAHRERRNQLKIWA